MKKSAVALLHVGVWVCYLIIIGIMIGVFFRSNHRELDQTARLINAFESLMIFAFMPSFITFYLYYFIIFPKYLKQKKFLLAIIFGALFSIATAMFGYIAIRFFIETGRIIDMDKGGKNGRDTAVLVIAVITIIATISGIVALVIKGFITWYEEIKLKEEMKQKNHETQLALVKAQLDPHFLFNTLNNIDVLLVKDSAEASNYLNKLSDILRFMLYETKTDKILLEKEIEYIDKYIALQKIRTSNANYVNFHVTGRAGKKTIAPMIFIPFIENAFKHSTNKKVDNAISVQIFINQESVQFVCENKYDPLRRIINESGGLGNELIEKRLQLIYPEKHTLELIKNTELYSVHLTIRNG